MTVHHPTLASGRWNDFTLYEQMANVGTEVGRAAKWKNKGNTNYFEKAFARAFELLDLTINDRKNSNRLKELLRVRECLADYFLFDNEYGSSDEAWSRYFLAFNYAARRHT